MALFQSKISWKIMRQRENKNYRSLSSLPDTQVGKDRERQEIKNIVSFRFALTQRVTENSKKIAKKFKKLKNNFMASFQANIGWKRLRKRENKKYRFVQSLPDS